MTCGEKISNLRKANGMTQEDLGKILNITYQAVSKWERDESSPDFKTMSQIAKVFQVPLSYFEEDGETIREQEQQAAASSVIGNYVGTCTVCGKMLKEGDEYIDSPKIICNSCADLAEQEKQKQEAEMARKKQRENKKAIKNQLGSGIDFKLILGLILAGITYAIFVSITFSSEDPDIFLGAVISTFFAPLSVFALVQIVARFINELKDKEEPEGYTLLISCITGGIFTIVNIVIFSIMYANFNDGLFIGFLFGGAIISFTFISQIMWGNVVRDIFATGGFTFKLPGFIFSLTIDSILWMIVTKIFLGIIAAIIFIVTTIIVALFAMVSSVITFIPCVISKSVKDKEALNLYS